jgi:hypothetical protein
VLVEAAAHTRGIVIEQRSARDPGSSDRLAK